MVVLEAMAANVPVVASNVGGVPELVQHGKTGLLFTPDDAGMREAVADVLADPCKARARAASARIQALQTYHPKAVAARHAEIYREALRTVA